jgi:hypothetical protein
MVLLEQLILAEVEAELVQQTLEIKHGLLGLGVVE